LLDVSGRIKLCGISVLIFWVGTLSFVVRSFHVRASVFIKNVLMGGSSRVSGTLGGKLDWEEQAFLADFFFFLTLFKLVEKGWEGERGGGKG